jgi:hypothetical protein
MPVTAVATWQVVLAIHIAAVVVGLGGTFAFPILDVIGARMDPRALPWYYRMREQLGKRLISPGLVVILGAGIYLASDLHQWSTAYVQVGLAAVIVIGGVGGAFFAPSERKLAELAERDIGAAGAGEVAWSGEFEALRRRVTIVNLAMSVLILVTVYLMTVQTGA